MIRVLIAAAVALAIALVIGPRFIEFLRRDEFGQHIREEGPQHHFAKQGTPTMGGLLILFAATIATTSVTPARSRSFQRPGRPSERWCVRLMKSSRKPIAPQASVANSTVSPWSV